MKPKQTVRMCADSALLLLLPLLMAYNMLGEAAHEWVGIAMFAMFILHHALNLRFTASVAKGKYTLRRIILTALDALLLIDMLIMMLSAVMLSRHVFGFLQISFGVQLARTLHLLGSYWGFALMSFHFGMHIPQLAKALRNALHISGSSKAKRLILRSLALTVSAYGMYSFVARGLTDYMLLKNQFVFFDFSEPLPLFLLAYASMMCFFAALGFGLANLAARPPRKQFSR
ncbi:MAG: DUF4405 domain-containing protein [Eubacteriales bacterium]|nr:DUF4405 domain-containing protein [Eubacteriales bacterium]